MLARTFGALRRAQVRPGACPLSRYTRSALAEASLARHPPVLQGGVAGLSQLRSFATTEVSAPLGRNVGTIRVPRGWLYCGACTAGHNPILAGCRGGRWSPLRLAAGAARTSAHTKSSALRPRAHSCSPAGPAQMTVRDALNSAMDEEMARDPKVWRLRQPGSEGLAPCGCGRRRAGFAARARPAACRLHANGSLAVRRVGRLPRGGRGQRAGPARP